MVGQDFHRQVLRNSSDAAHTLGRILGRPLLRVGVNRAEERHGALVYANADLSRIYPRIPGELLIDVLLQLNV